MRPARAASLGLLVLLATFPQVALAADDPHAGGHPGGAAAGFGPGIQSAPDETVPAGQVLVFVLKGGESPVPGATVILRETVQSVAEGDAKKERTGRTGPDGLSRFDGIATSIRTIARVTVRAFGADYTVPEFRPLESTGHRIVVPVYEATASPVEAMVGMRGFIYVQLREGEFVFDLLFRVFSLGDKTWLPSGVHLDLPNGLSGFDSPEPEGGAVLDGPHGAKIVGSFPPGQKDFRMNFRLPAGRAESESFRFSLPPNVAEMRVITEQAPGMSLNVAGFEPVQQARGPEGTRVLVTRRALAPGQEPLSALVVELHGLPTIGPERWYAVGLALALAASGLWLARRSKSGNRLESGEVRQARRLLLRDLAALEAAREKGNIGPQTYERARRELVLALARLEDDPATA